MSRVKREPKVAFTISVPMDIAQALQNTVDAGKATDRSDAVAVLVRYAQTMLDLDAAGVKLLPPDQS